MVTIEYTSSFKKSFTKLAEKEQAKKQVRKIIAHPEIGKPMRYARKGTRELYLGSFRIAYAYNDEKIIFLALYHKDKQ